MVQLVPRDPSPPTKLAFLPPFTSNEPVGQSLALLFGPQKLLKVLIEEPPVRIEEPTPSKGEALFEPMTKPRKTDLITVLAFPKLSILRSRERKKKGIL